MNDFRQRMFDEHSQLIDRINKLKSFLWGALFNGLENGDKTLLIEQLGAMKAYEKALAERISRL